MPDLVETPESENAVEAAQILNRNIDRSSSRNRHLGNPEVFQTIEKLLCNK